MSLCTPHLEPEHLCVPCSDAATIAELRARVQRLESALRPFSNTVCSMRWLWKDTADAEGEARAEEDGLTVAWTELLDAHEALEGDCDAEECRAVEKRSTDR